MRHYIHLDFETMSQADIKTVGPAKYFEDPTTQMICMVWHDPVTGESKVVFPDDPTPAWVGADWCTCVAFNSAFEFHALKRFYGVEMDMQCTSAQACYSALPGNLEGVAEALGLDVQKDKEGAKVLRKYFKHDDFHTIPLEDLQTIVAYCRKDVEVEMAIANAIPQLPAQEQEVWELDQKINHRGIRLDAVLAMKTLQIITAAQNVAIAELKDLTDGSVEKPTQGKRILDWMERQHCIESDSLNKESVDNLLRLNLPPNVRKVLLIRQRCAKASTAKFKRMLECQMDDGRIRDTLRYHGATTGRWAGKGIQIQNLPRGTVKEPERLIRPIIAKDLHTIEAIADNVFDAGKSILRSCLMAGRGKRLLVADYSGIEARVLAWLAGDRELVQKFNEGVDLYCDLASRIYNRPITKADAVERQIGKAGILGLGYQMGARKFHATLASQGMDVSMNMAEGVVHIYRQTYSKIKDLWYNLENDAKRAFTNIDESNNFFLTNRGVLTYTLPSGRVLSYQNARLVDGKYGQKIRYQRPLGKKMVWADTYGGKLTENIVQAIARDLLAESMLTASREGIRLIGTVHDEIIAEEVEYKAERTYDRLEAIMQSEKPWGVGIPLNVEGYISERFKK